MDETKRQSSVGRASPLADLEDGERKTDDREQRADGGGRPSPTRAPPQPPTPEFITPVVGPPIPRRVPGRAAARAKFLEAQRVEENKRCCRNCIYSTRPAGRCFRALLARYPTLLVCTNCADAPGTLMEVLADRTCRNYHPRFSEMRHRTLVPSPGQEFCYIPLTKDLQAMVDPEDYEWLCNWNWRAKVFPDGTVYAATRIHGRKMYMHRLIMNPPEGKVVDHIDHNGVNNRRCNLRNCNQAQNIHNQRKRFGSSRFKGVHRTRSGGWAAGIVVDGRPAHMGVFDDETEAARARDRWAFALCGRFAWLNFPQEFAGKDPADPEFEAIRELAQEKQRRREKKAKARKQKADEKGKGKKAKGKRKTLPGQESGLLNRRGRRGTQKK